VVEIGRWYYHSPLVPTDDYAELLLLSVQLPREYDRFAIADDRPSDFEDESDEDEDS